MDISAPMSFLGWISLVSGPFKGADMSRGVGILRGGYIWGGLEWVCPGVGMSRKFGISGGGYVLQWVGVGMSRGGYVWG